FLSRARAEVKSAVQNALRKRKVADVEHGEKVAIPMRGIVEPAFNHSRRAGRNEHVVPGNKEYVRGDEIPRPTGGEGRGGSQGSPDGSGEDAFEFTLSKDEFLDMFFEDLELPDLVKKSLRETFAVDLQRAGYTVTGSPANLSVRRTMRNSMARRISLRRPKPWEIEALREALAAARARDDAEEAQRLERELERAEFRTKIIPYIDPIDVRYNRFERVPRPNTEAVMFCLMDVSGSMTEAMKDLAKRFFLLLHVFLTRRYKHVELVFIRHTSNAQEVDEETFFHSRETGGTIVSTALEEMLRVLRDRYAADAWNIYAAQASDGDNYTEDSDRCSQLLSGEILPITQYFAYIEVGAEATLRHGFPSPPTDLWRTYSQTAATHANFAMRKVADPTQIFPVFRELFSKQREHG
ncbi:MAG: YeaH/YhbH family protein, partial [Acetobacteraceae bacterium]